MLLKKLLHIMSVITLICATIFFVSCQKNETPTVDYGNISSSFFEINVNNNTLYGEVSNETNYIDLNDKLYVAKGYNISIFKDREGQALIPTNTINLEIGNNICYLLLTNIDTNKKTLFELTIRRLPIYTINFDTFGGTNVETLYLQENEIIDLSQVTIPTKTGYQFVKWDLESGTKIKSNITINAIWQANKYKIYYDDNIMEVFYDDYVALPIPERPSNVPIYSIFYGYFTDHNEWYFDKQGNFFYNSPDGKPMKYRFTEDITVHSRWGRG